ncbi:hypothetical protein [Amycolatopsis pigmentata]|uniref:DUF4878 domain-containing protein n=1 Tax=Amycolatopsis pigmentata TaxID=450801 RepID=A0ABW5FTE5_9PSEU
MTTPPNGPWGQPGPHGPRGRPGPWGQPGPYGPGGPRAYPPPPASHPAYPGGGFPPGPPARPGYPPGPPQGDPRSLPAPPDAWRPDPWSTPPQPEPDETPRPKKTGRIVGAVAALALLAGGCVTAALLLTGKGGESPPALGPGAAPGTGTSPGVTAPGGAASRSYGADPESVARAMVTSINAKDIGQYTSLLCAAPEQKVLEDLKADWDGDSSLHATLAGPPAVDGGKATATLTLTYHGQSTKPELNLKRQGSGWCADIPS